VRSSQIEPDGHCLYSAVADQLALLGILTPSRAQYGTTRLAASNYIYSHPDDFLPFLPSSDEEGTGSGDTGLMTPRQFEKYCAAIRDTGVWGGEPEILALSRAFRVPIHVIQSGSPPVVEHNPDESPPGVHIANQKVARISYHRRMYGLGEVRVQVSLTRKRFPMFDPSITTRYGQSLVSQRYPVVFNPS
jgi:OTU domain-containing protein 6